MASKESFDFNANIPPTNWLVEGIIPLGQLIFCLAHSGQGKSYFIEALAACMIFAKNFLGRLTIPGDVLLVDQDTPQNVIRSRLVSFREEGEAPKFDLFLHSHEGLSITDKSLINIIKQYPTAVLIIIDSFHSIMGSTNPSLTNDMNFACNQLTALLHPNRTIWVNHHISEKRLLSLADMMFGDDIGNLFMGNSALVQRLDSAFILSGASTNGVLQELYVRPWGKRALIPQRPFLTRFEGNAFVFEGELEDMRNQDECVCDLRILFTEKPDCGFKVREAYEEMGRKHGINKVYKAFSHMESTGEARMERGSSNQFKYFPTDRTRKPRVIIGSLFTEKDKES